MSDEHLLRKYEVTFGDHRDDPGEKRCLDAAPGAKRTLAPTVSPPMR